MSSTPPQGGRRLIIRRPGPQGPSPQIVYPVTSVHGRTGAITANPADYSALTNLTIAGTLRLTCADDGSVHKLVMRKFGAEYVPQWEKES